MPDDSLSIELVTNDTSHDLRCDSSRAIYELDKQIDMLKSHADKLDYLVAACSGYCVEHLMSCGLATLTLPEDEKRQVRQSMGSLPRLHRLPVTTETTLREPLGFSRSWPRFQAMRARPISAEVSSITCATSLTTRLPQALPSLF